MRVGTLEVRVEPGVLPGPEVAKGTAPSHADLKTVIMSVSVYSTTSCEEGLWSERTVGHQSLDICSCGADDREGDRLDIICAGGTAAGRDGGSGARWEICCECCWSQEGEGGKGC
jgi:hypothetical protein